MRMRITGSLLLIALAGPAIAQTSPCDALNSTVEDQIKKAASTVADGITDNSAPRATMRELQIANSLSLIRINLDLMAQNKCPSRKIPVDPMIYLGEALDCELALRKGENDPVACKRESWHGLSSKPPANSP